MAKNIFDSYLESFTFYIQYMLSKTKITGNSPRTTNCIKRLLTVEVMF